LAVGGRWALAGRLAGFWNVGDGRCPVGGRFGCLGVLGQAARM